MIKPPSYLDAAAPIVLLIVMVILAQAAIALIIIDLGRRLEDPGVQGPKPKFDLLGAILSAAGLFFVVFGTLLAGPYGWFRATQDFVIGSTVVIPAGGISPMWLFELIGALLLAAFFWHIGRMERAGKEPLLSTRMFKNRISNLGLVTQNIQSGLILTPATVGILLSSMAAGRLAKKYSQSLLIKAGFVVTLVGIGLLLLLASEESSVWSFFPGLFFVGVGVGVMLTSSVNVVQSSFPEKDQGEISRLSPSVSNLGSSLGVAIAGTVIVSSLVTGNEGYALALIVLGVFGVVGLVAALLLPKNVGTAQPEPNASST